MHTLEMGVLYCLSGELEVISGGETLTISSGTAILVPSGTEVGYQESTGCSRECATDLVSAGCEVG
jgi:quercetin dioxygenase-like cupin family protein